jgi:hypothetical protein
VRGLSNRPPNTGDGKRMRRLQRREIGCGPNNSCPNITGITPTMALATTFFPIKNKNDRSHRCKLL